ncbi:MAG: hypothetical protein H0V07_06710 [Propionibacteriales bacterium]|nr:hypothetical protein [Propionibacteriales bacterium]
MAPHPAVLIALVIRQIRGRPLTTRTLLLPLALVRAAEAEYLHDFPITGAGP